MNNPQSFKKVEWLKVALAGKVKRIYNPSKDLKCLSNQIKSHFKELNGYSLTTLNQLREHEYILQWVPSGNLPITITDNDQLEEIYMMHGLSDDQKVPRFEVNAGLIWFSLTESVKNSELKNSSLTEDDKSDYLEYSGQNQQIQDDHHYLQCSEHLDQQMECQMSMLENSEEEMSNSEESSSDEDEEALLQQHLTHYIRMEVEREVISKLDQLHFEDQESEYEEDNGVEEELPLSSSVDIRVSIMSNNNRSSEVQLSNPIFSRIKSFFQKKNLPINPLHQGLILSQKEIYMEVQPDTRCSLKWTIRNESHQTWPSGLQLVNVFSNPQIQMGAQYINHQLQPQESSDIDIVLYIPSDFKDSAQIVMFRIISEEGRFIGEPFIAYIKVNRAYRPLLDSELGMSDSLYSMNEEDQVSEEQMLGPASLLVDEGYGSFDRIYSVLKCLKGDAEQSRECLSLLIFHECQV